LDETYSLERHIIEDFILKKLQDKCDGNRSEILDMIKDLLEMYEKMKDELEEHSGENSFKLLGFLELTKAKVAGLFGIILLPFLMLLLDII